MSTNKFIYMSHAEMVNQFLIHLITKSNDSCWYRLLESNHVVKQAGWLCLKSARRTVILRLRDKKPLKNGDRILVILCKTVALWFPIHIAIFWRWVSGAGYGLTGDAGAVNWGHIWPFGWTNTLRGQEDVGAFSTSSWCMAPFGPASVPVAHFFRSR